MSVVLPAPKNPVTIVNGVFAEPSGASEEEAIAVDGVARASASASPLDLDSSFGQALLQSSRSRNAPRARRARAPGDESCLGRE